MTVLEFKGYTVLSMRYNRNDTFDPAIKKVQLNPKFSEEHTIQGSTIVINLKVVVGDKSDGTVPFRVECMIQGIFEYNRDEDDQNLGVTTFITNNGVAILYPYARAIISNLTAFSNEYPGYNMPTVNISKVLASKTAKDDSNLGMN